MLYNPGFSKFIPQSLKQTSQNLTGFSVTMVALVAAIKPCDIASHLEHATPRKAAARHFLQPRLSTSDGQEQQVQNSDWHVCLKQLLKATSSGPQARPMMHEGDDEAYCRSTICQCLHKLRARLAAWRQSSPSNLALGRVASAAAKPSSPSNLGRRARPVLPGSRTVDCADTPQTYNCKLFGQTQFVNLRCAFTSAVVRMQFVERMLGQVAAASHAS